MTTVLDIENSRTLPSTWEIASVGDIAELLRGVSYGKADASSEPRAGYVPILRANNIDGELNQDDLVYVVANRVSQVQIIKEGDIVIAMSSGSKRLVGKAAQARRNGNYAFGAFCGVVRASPQLSARYFDISPLKRRPS